MEKLISDELYDLLCQQIVKEKLNANIYLFIAGFLKGKGLDNLGDIFVEQHSEETSHSLMFFNLLTDLGVNIINIGEIPPVEEILNVIIDVGELFLNREIATTESLENIKEMAISDKNSVVEEFMRGMIKLQQKEYEESTSLLDRCLLTENSWSAVLLWDLSLKDK